MEKVRAIVLYRRLFLLVVTIAGLYFLYRVRIIMIPFIIAFFMAYVLNPLVKAGEKKKLSRTWAIILVYLMVFGLAGLAIRYGLPRIIGEFNHLAGTVPKLTAEVQGLLDHFQTRYSKFLPSGLKEVVDQRVRLVEDFLLDGAKAATAALVRMFAYLPALIIAPVFAFYMLKDRDRIKESFTLTIPRRYRNDVLAIGRDLDEIIWGFFRSNLLLSFIVGSLTGLGMFLIGLDFAVSLGLLAGVTELIPYIGPMLSAVPAISLALLVSRKTAIYAALVILVVQQLENAVLSPKIMGRSMNLHPLVVIFVVLAGGELYGLLGVLVAVPLAASVKVILRYVYLKLVDQKQAR